MLKIKNPEQKLTAVAVAAMVAFNGVCISKTPATPRSNTAMYIEIHIGIVDSLWEGFYPSHFEPTDYFTPAMEVKARSFHSCFLP